MILAFAKEHQILAHALGLNRLNRPPRGRYRTVTAYRNYLYFTKRQPECDRNVELGFLQVDVERENTIYYSVTKAGIAMLSETYGIRIKVDED